MHRQPLLQLLAAYQPTDSAEQVFKAQTLAFIRNYPDCFERTLALGHITASAWVLNHDQSQALLLHHAKLDQWFQLGGHCDGDSDVLAVALKEAREESGIAEIVALSPLIFDLDIHQIPANAREVAHDHYDVRFLLGVVGEQSIVPNHEAKALRWISKERLELPTASRSVVRMFDKWCKLAVMS
ncbi:MAG TPA: NUDIX hydrolase [Candidatus Babeliales bacterium]|nr:NUDIX hydrolase [Candidatus Babeliales bacterium]